MPELPEVESVAAALRRNLEGSRLTGLEVRFAGVLSDPPARVRRAVVGRRLDTVRRHGKYLILDFEGESWWMLHLRMTGQILDLEGYRPDKHVHLVLDFDGRPVYYRDIRKFGRFTLVDDPLRPSAIAHIGPDMLRIRFADFAARLEGRRAPIKALLLDQRIAAGVGNIYADEALFRAGILPGRPAADLDEEEMRRVWRNAKDVMRLAIRHGGTTFLNFTDFHGQPGNFRRKLRVYQRSGEACGRCGEAIERCVVAGRGTHFCPSCQV